MSFHSKDKRRTWPPLVHFFQIITGRVITDISIITFRSIFFQPFQLHCDTCSLVTSSGQLLGKSAGKDIDSAECVIRMNDAPIRGFEKDVGRRTTVRVVGHSNFRTIFQNKLRTQYVHFRDPLTRAENVVIAWLYATNIYKNPAYRLTLNYSQMYRNVTFFMHTLAMMQHNNEVFHNETGITR